MIWNQGFFGLFNYSFCFLLFYGKLQTSTNNRDNSILIVQVQQLPVHSQSCVLYNPSAILSTPCESPTGLLLLFLINLFIFGCVGSSFLCEGFLQLQQAGASHYHGLSLRSTGSRRAGSAVVAHGPSCSAACGILPDQGSNPCPLHWQADCQPLCHQGSPWIIFKANPGHLIPFHLEIFQYSTLKDKDSSNVTIIITPLKKQPKFHT